MRLMPKILRSPVWGRSNPFELAACYLHNSIRVAQNLSRRNSHAQIKLGDMPSLNNRVRLTYGHRNPLKKNQDGNSRLAQNILNLLNLRNYRETRELASNKHEQYSGSPEHQHCLGSAIIFRGCIKENQQYAVEVSTNFFGSCNGSAFLLYEGNQQRTVLYRNPNLAYERVVTQSYEVNQLSLSESDNKPSLRGEALISAVPHSANEISPVQEKRKGGISNPTLWLVVYRQTTENQAVHSIAGSNPVQLSDSDLAFLRCSDLSLRPQASSTQAEKLEFGFSSLSRSTLASISSTSSYGKRMPLVVDLLFLNPVAIRPPVSWCLCTIQEKNINKTLEVFVHRELRCLCTSSICGVRNSEARQCGNTNRASYHQDS